MAKSDHQQLQILKTLASVLVAAATDAGNRVRVEGINGLPSSALPAIEIEVGEEEVARLSYGRDGRPTLQRDLVVEVGLLVKGADGYLERASEMLAQVEEALGAEGLIALDCLLDGRPRLRGCRPQLEDRGAELVYRIRSLWVLRYFTSEGLPRARVTTP